MTKNLVCVSPYTTVAETSSIMIKHRLRRVLVVENNFLIGIVTYNDIPQNIKPQLSVKDIMTINPVTINENSDVLEAAQIMKNLNIGSLPVINNLGQAVGIITSFDLNQLTY